MNIKSILETINYRVAQSSPYLYQSFGMENPRIFDYFDKDEEVAGNFTADESGKVFEIIAEIPQLGICYRWVDPDYINKLTQDTISRGIDPTIALDNIKFTEVKTEDNILFKVKAICQKIHLKHIEEITENLPDGVLLNLAKMSIEKNITIKETIETLIAGDI